MVAQASEWTGADPIGSSVVDKARQGRGREALMKMNPRVVFASLIFAAAASCVRGDEPVAASIQDKPAAIILFAESPIRSSGEYSFKYWTSGLESVDPAKHAIELEVRTADNAKQVAHVPNVVSWTVVPGVTPGSLLAGGGQGLTDAQRLWIGTLPDGEYVTAVLLDGKRVSNVARVRIDAKLDPAKEPALVLTPLPLAPGQSAPCLGLTVTGPDPVDPSLDYMAIASPTLIIDGVPYDGRSSGGWAGANRAIGTGERYLQLLRHLDSLGIDHPSAIHRVKARIGAYESAEVVMPASAEPEMLWDAATANVVKLPLEEARQRAMRPLTVQGAVTDGAGRPLEGVTIKAVVAGGPDTTEMARVTSGADGKYTIAFGPTKDEVAGRFSREATITASKEGFFDKDFPDHGVFHITNMPASAFDSEEKLPVLRPFQTGALDFTMLPTATVKGRVVDASGKGVLSGRQIDIQAEVKNGYARELASGKLDSDGRFAFGSIPTGKIFVRIYLPGDAQYVSDLVDLAKPQTYEVDFTWDEAKRRLSMRSVGAAAAP
jgi:hypothetical protein